MENHASKNPSLMSDEKILTDRIIQLGIRVGFLLLTFTMCYMILRPFLVPLLWGAIIAIGIFPLHQKLVSVLGGQEKSAATVITLLLLALVILPAVLFTDTAVDGLQRVSQRLEAGTLTVPPPPENVSGWPFIGKPLSELWKLASVNIETAIEPLTPQLKVYVPKLLSAAAGIGLTVLQFIISIILAGWLLVHAQKGGKTSRRVFTRLAGEQGEEFSEIAAATIRSVVQGVLGVAVIQSLLAGVGLLLIDVPAAGLWVVIVLFLAVVQLPLILILGPIAAYVFSTTATAPAVIFLLWSLLVSASDIFLKPLFLGRGAKVPTLVILLGVIGGTLLFGLIGLFVGAVVLALGYKIFQALLEPEALSDQ